VTKNLMVLPLHPETKRLRLWSLRLERTAKRKLLKTKRKNRTTKRKNQ